MAVEVVEGADAACGEVVSVVIATDGRPVRDADVDDHVAGMGVASEVDATTDVCFAAGIPWWTAVAVRAAPTAVVEAEADVEEVDEEADTSVRALRVAAEDIGSRHLKQNGWLADSLVPPSGT